MRHAKLHEQISSVLEVCIVCRRSRQDYLSTFTLTPRCVTQLPSLSHCIPLFTTSAAFPAHRLRIDRQPPTLRCLSMMRSHVRFVETAVANSLTPHIRCCTVHRSTNTTQCVSPSLCNKANNSVFEVTFATRSALISCGARRCRNRVGQSSYDAS